MSRPPQPHAGIDESHLRRRVRLAGLPAGPLLGALVWALLPSAYLDAQGAAQVLSSAAMVTAGLAVWMAVWWMTEAIPVYATALLPLAVLPLGDAVSMGEAASAYANELIFLFMGGFILALGMQRWGLHRRIALTALRFAGTRPPTVLGGFMIVTAVLSMWVSNTATALMMMPIALSLIDLLELDSDGDEKTSRFAVSLLLGIAYAASIGGLGTIIGSPPNVFVVSYVEKELGREISFARWMMIGVPLVCAFLPLAWFLLVRVLFPTGLRHLPGSEQLRQAHAKLGRPNPGEWAVFGVFMLTASCWMTRPLLARIEIGGAMPFARLTDAGIAIIAALVLFVIPVDRRGRTFVMNWDWAARLPWGVLILFGGGLSLAGAIDQSGLSDFLGSQVSGWRVLPPLLFVAAVTAMIIFLTELTSNTATTAALVPVLAAVAKGIGMDPVQLVVPAALAASCAFMLPVATPPNAIVFGTGRLSIPQMARAGLWLNLIGIALITGAAYGLVARLL